jgi:hypothetical protein
MTIPALYCILTGVLMVGQWIFFIAKGQVPEWKTQPYRIGLHLAAEFFTAGALVIAGLGLLGSTAWGPSIAFFALGALFYTLIQSPGYFAQRREWPMVIMFAALMIFTLINLIILLSNTL